MKEKKMLPERGAVAKAWPNANIILYLYCSYINIKY